MATTRRVLTAFFVSVFAFQTLGLLNLVRVPMAAAQTATVDPVRSLADTAGAIQATLGVIAHASAAGADVSGLLQQLATQAGVLQAGLAALDGRLANADAGLDGLVQQGAVPLEKATALAAYRSGVQTAAAALLQSLASLQATVAPDTISAALGALQQLRAAPGDSSSRAVVDPGRLPHRRADIPRRDLQARSPILPGQAPPGPADLASTVDASMTPEIQAQATASSFDPVALFAFVRNSVEFQPYFGSLKGAPGTLLEKAGNDMDQASLLIALLRASNVPARYVAGVVEVPIAKAMNWVGVQTPEAAVEVFARNGFPFQVHTSADGTFTHLSFFHVWVEAFLPDGPGRGSASRSEWVQLDPSFKQHDSTPGVDLPTATGFDATAFFQGASGGATLDTAASFFRNLDEAFIGQEQARLATNLFSYVQAVIGPTATNGDVLGTKRIRPIARHQLNTIAQSFPFQTFAPQLELAELPSSFRHLANFAMFGFSQLFALPELAGKSVTISYVAATPADQAIIDAFGGILNVFPAFIVNLKPRLAIEGQIVAEGERVPLGSSQILRSAFRRPLEVTFDVNDRVVTTGAAYAVALDLQRIPLEALRNRAETFRLVVASLGPNPPLTADIVSEGLHLTGQMYFAETDVLSDVAGKTANVTFTREPSEAIISQDLTVLFFFGVPLFVRRAGVGVDVKRNIINPTSTVGDPRQEVSWMLATGSLGSAGEHAVFEQFYGLDAVSTEKILTLANRRGLRIFAIDRSNVAAILPQLDTFTIVKQNIAEFVAAGFVAVVPERNLQVDDFFGAGWIVADLSTGSAGYFIAGALTAGGATTKAADVGDFLGKGLLTMGYAEATAGLLSVAAEGAALTVFGANVMAGTFASTGLAGATAVAVGGFVAAVGLGMIAIAAVGLYVLVKQGIITVSSRDERLRRRTRIVRSPWMPQPIA